MFNALAKRKRVFERAAARKQRIDVIASVMVAQWAGFPTEDPDDAPLDLEFKAAWRRAREAAKHLVDAE